jgi:hypothetical protein
MKFYVETKKKGEALKKSIRKLMEKRDYISVADVIELFGMLPDPESKNHIWSVADFKMRLRQNKTGWFLYLPEPTIFEYHIEENDIEEKAMVTTDDPEMDNFLMALQEIMSNMIAEMKEPSLLACRVISKKKSVIKEEPAYFHGFFQSSVPKKDGTVITQPLGIVSMMDGTVRQVKPDSIVFGMIE